MKISSIYSNGMILQRNVENRLWGRVDPKETVQVLFDEKELAVSITDSLWECVIPAQKEGGPHDISVISSVEATPYAISDVYFGDVFILGGQSNMELPVALTTDLHFDEIESADFPLIRQFEVPKEPVFGNKKDMLTGGQWLNCDQKNIWGFSAIGFYFAKYKQLKDQVPVGLVQAAVGGAPAECLMSEENLLDSYARIEPVYKDISCCSGNKSNPCLWCYKEKMAKIAEPGYIENTQKEDMKRVNGWHEDLDKKDPGLKDGWAGKIWSENEIAMTIDMPKTFYQTQFEDFLGSIWIQKEVEVPASWIGSRVQLRLGTLIDGDVSYVNGQKVGEIGFKYPPRRYWIPDGVLKAGKNLITVRLIMDGNIGGAVKETPFCLKNGEEEISLEGTWSVRPGVRAERLEQQTFFLWWPTALYNGMMYPLRGYASKAVLFYQGESNGEHPEYYGELLKDLVKEWRTLYGEHPFIMAEITHWMGEGPVYETDAFEGVRAVQNQVVNEIPDCYIVKTYDLGWYNDLHPQNKKEVAMRFLEVYEKIQEKN